MSGGGGMAVGNFLQGSMNLMASKEERRQMRKNANALRTRANMVREQGRVVQERRKKSFQKLRGEQSAKRGTLDESTMESLDQETDRRMLEELVEIHRKTEMEALGLIEEAKNMDTAERNQRGMEPMMLLGMNVKSFGSMGGGKTSSAASSDSAEDSQLIDDSYGAEYSGNQAGNQYQK